MFLVVLFSSFIARGQSNVFEKTLANGFQIFVHENHDQPQVYGAVAIRAGSKHDPVDATGMAHYLEHMLFKGTQTMGTVDYQKEKIWLDSITYCYDQLGKTTNADKRLAIQLQINRLSIKAADYAIPNEMDKLLAEIGSSGVNAYTMVESTVYHNVFPSNQLEKWMSLYAARFDQPVFRLFQSELETVYEEKNRKSDDMGSSIFDFYLERFFKHHPYGQQTTIGKTEHLKNPSLTKMYDYFNTYYVPNNMALVISGDVDHNNVFQLAERYFSRFSYKEVPPFPNYVEEEFKGKEVIKIRRTPVKAGVLGFRLPPNKHPDMVALRVIAEMLSNSSSSGSINQLVNNDKVLMAGLEYMPYNDGGTAFLYFVPKIVGQRLKKAEQLVLNCVEEIKAGKFSDEELNRVKNYLIKVYDASFENNAAAASNLINAYVKGVSPQKYFDDLNAIKGLDRQKIVEVAKRYFNGNCLAMYSRMGFVKKDKISKPPFKPVVPKNDSDSQFAQEWRKLKEDVTQPHFVNFKTDIDSFLLDNNTYVLRNTNPYNKIASVGLTFGVGSHRFPQLKYIAAYLNNCGTKNHPLNEFKSKLHELACDMVAETSLNRFTLRVNVPEENLSTVLSLLYELMDHPQLDQKIVDHLAKEIKLNHRVDKRSVEYNAKALNDFILYGKESAYLSHMPLKQFKNSGLKTIDPVLDSVMTYALRISYTGQLSNNEIKAIFSSTGWIKSRKTALPLYIPKAKSIDKNIVYLLPKRNARQMHIYLLKKGTPFTVDQTPYINAFNKYFGGDMSSLMFQEVREFRSLAYATYASYQSGAMPNLPSTLIVFAGTQNDKGNECISTINNLVNQMPLKEQRFASVKNSLIKSASASRPSFRQLISTVLNWKVKGYNQDPNELNLDAYQKLTINDLERFYSTSVQQQPQAIAISGKVSKLNKRQLAQYGKIKKIKKRQIAKL